MDLNREIILWNIYSREERKIGSKSREKGDLSLCLPPPPLLGRLWLTSLIVHKY